jgi:hypothetical protein
VAINRFWIEDVFLPELAFLKGAITNRLLPAFDTVSDEAAEVSRAAWSAACSQAPADGLVDLAQETMRLGGDHYVMLENTRQGFVNLCAIAIWHLVEQQCLTLLRQEFRPRSRQHVAKDLTVEEFKRELRARGVELAQVSGWSDLEELRLVANVVKHAEGVSAGRLRTLRPAMFMHPDYRDSPPVLGEVHTTDEVYRPLSGTDLYLTDGDLLRYCGAADSFWRAVAQAANRNV